MFTPAPIVASPRYARCIAFDPGPSTVFFSSTKLPTRASGSSVAPARRCANGPTRARSPIVESVTIEWLYTTTPSPRREFTIRTPACSSQPAPITVSPSIDTPG